jgi:hypothetical protein
VVPSNAVLVMICDSREVLLKPKSRHTATRRSTCTSASAFRHGHGRSAFLLLVPTTLSNSVSAPGSHSCAPDNNAYEMDGMRLGARRPRARRSDAPIRRRPAMPFIGRIGGPVGARAAADNSNHHKDTSQEPQGQYWFANQNGRRANTHSGRVVSSYRQLSEMAPGCLRQSCRGGSLPRPQRNAVGKHTYPGNRYVGMVADAFERSEGG